VFTVPSDNDWQFQLCMWQNSRDGAGSRGEAVDLAGPGVYTASQSPSSFRHRDGAAIDFGRPDGLLMGVLLRSRSGCPVSDLVEPNCWDQRWSYLPMRVRLTVVAVSEGEDFSGWAGYVGRPGTIRFTSAETVPSTINSSYDNEVRFSLDGFMTGGEEFEYVEIDLSQLGGSGAAWLPQMEDGAYQLLHTVSAGIEAGIKKLPVTVFGHGGVVATTSLSLEIIGATSVNRPVAGLGTRNAAADASSTVFDPRGRRVTAGSFGRVGHGVYVVVSEGRAVTRLLRGQARR
jgi:hypothetical protein